MWFSIVYSISHFLAIGKKKAWLVFLQSRLETDKRYGKELCKRGDPSGHDAKDEEQPDRNKQESKQKAFRELERVCHLENIERDMPDLLSNGKGGFQPRRKGWFYAEQGENIENCAGKRDQKARQQGYENPA